jgi:hypothetical protein
MFSPLFGQVGVLSFLLFVLLAHSTGAQNASEGLFSDWGIPSIGMFGVLKASGREDNTGFFGLRNDEGSILPGLIATLNPLFTSQGFDTAERGG